MAVRRHVVLGLSFVALVGCHLSAPLSNGGRGRDASPGTDLGTPDTLAPDDVPAPHDVPIVPDVQSTPDAPSAEDPPPADAGADGPIVDGAEGVDAVPDSVVVLDEPDADAEGDDAVADSAVVPDEPDVNSGDDDADTDSGVVLDGPGVDLGDDDAPATEAGTPLRVGSCADRVDWTQAIVDRSTTGTGACAASTVADLLDVIQTEHPELADIFRPVRIDAGWLCLPDGTSCSCLFERQCVSPTDVKVVRYGDGFRIALQRLSGASSISSYHYYEYWYFETNGSCHPDLVGYFSMEPSLGPACQGSPLWDFGGWRTSGLDCVNGRLTSSNCRLDGGAVDG